MDAVCPECGHEFYEEIEFNDPFPDVDFNAEFHAMGTENAEEFGVEWLRVNTAIRGALLRAGIDHANHRIRWMAFHIARGMCLELQRRTENANKKEVLMA